MTDYATPFLVALNAKLSPQMKAAVSAWQLQESGSNVRGNNPWNLHIGPACPSTAGEGVKGYKPSQPLRSTTIAGLIGNRYAGTGDRNVAIFDTPEHGSAACARNLLSHGTDWTGYSKVVQSARIGDPVGFLNALAASAWSAGRYGTRDGGPNKLLAIYRRLAPAPTPKPAPKPAPKPEVVMSDPHATAAITNADYIDRIAEAAGIGTRIAPYTAKIREQVQTLDAKVASPTPDPVPADPVPADVVAKVLGPDPVPNNAQPPDSTYGAEMTLKEFEGKYGRSPEQVYSEVATSLLRPDLSRWDIHDTNGDHSQADQGRRGDATKQQAMLDYFAGKLPFSTVAGYFGGWYANLGLVDISAIHDLGAK